MVPTTFVLSRAEDKTPGIASRDLIGTWISISLPSPFNWPK